MTLMQCKFWISGDQYIAALDDSRVVEEEVAETAVVDNCISTQTPQFDNDTFVEVETHMISATKRSVQV